MAAVFAFYNKRNGNSKYSRTVMAMIKDCLKLVSKYSYMYQVKSVKGTCAFFAN